MRLRARRLFAALVALLAPVLAFAQAPNAAIVNGQPIPESAVQRGLRRVPPADHAKARPEILDFLIDNILIEQSLAAAKVTVEPTEVAARLDQIKAEVKKQNQEFAKLLGDLQLTEDELKTQIAADLRWDKYVASQATDANLQALFAQNPEMFDGTMVRARHILVIVPPGSDAKAAETVKTGLNNLRGQILQTAAAELAKVPASASPQDRELARTKALELEFSKFAGQHSACPSKKEGGDLSWFPRVGSMVEPFAKAAFAVKPYEISEAVATPHGFHLIMVTGRKPGTPTELAKVKEEVKEIYGMKLRDGLSQQLRATAKIAITPPAK